MLNHFKFLKCTKYKTNIKKNLKTNGHNLLMKVDKILVNYFKAKVHAFL